MAFKKKLNKKWLLIGLGACLTVGSVVTATAVVTSCSDNSTPQTNKFQIKKQFYSFNPKTEKTSGTRELGFTFDLNPETNQSSSKTFYESIKKLAKDFFIKEFSQNLKQFYEALEFELEGPTEVEAEIFNINVKDFKILEKDATHPFGSVQVTTEIEYEVETEANDSEKTEIKKQEKTLTLIPKMAGIDEIKDIITKLKDGNNPNKDAIDELKELYFGDDDINNFNPTDWENSGGVLSYLYGFVRQKNVYAKMAGWVINISEAAYTPSVTKARPDATHEIWAPSILGSIFYPDLNGNNQPTDKPEDNDLTGYNWNLDQLSKITVTEFRTNLGITATTKVNITDAIKTKLAEYGIDLTKFANFNNAQVKQIMFNEADFEVEIFLDNDDYDFPLNQAWFKA